jgi:hypothetical protein
LPPVCSSFTAPSILSAVRRVLVALVLVLLAAGCGGTKTVTVTTTVTRTVTAPPRTTTVRVYFLRDGKVAPVSRRVASTSEGDLLQALFDGPTQRERAAGLATAVGGKQQGINPIGKAGEAQIVYTLSQFAPSRRVRGGTRADFEDFTPAILVESPLPFQAVSAPLRVTGSANTFEATFEYELLDPAGKVLASHFVTATSGSGTRGTFDFTIPFEAPNGLGKLVVFERSAADGSRIHQVEIPLTLAR